MLIYLQMIDSPQDRTKFEAVYHLYKNRMYHTAYSILRNEQDAEDAVHHAFVKIVENIEKISEPECPKTAGYVVTIVENTAINIYRRKQRHPMLPLDDAVAGVSVEYTGINELARCMAKLPALQRQVLLLKYHHGYTSRQIAGMLGLSVANATKIKQRAKQKLEILCKEAQIL